MNLLIDSFRNMILIYEEGTKKIQDFWHEKTFDYSLKGLANIQKAIIELVKDDESLRQRLSKGTNVVIPDNGIGFGLFELPLLSKYKLKDVFLTRFKSCYPNYESFFVSEYEYERNDAAALHFYTFCKKELTQGITSALKGIGSSANNMDFYASTFALSADTKSLFPHATLFVGKQDAELILNKGGKVLFIHDFGFGLDWLNASDSFVESAYNQSNQKALQFSSFATENFAKKIVVCDENIEKTIPNATLSLPSPKEVRIMKDDVLATYMTKNRFRKFYCLITDIVTRFASAPWFLPITSIEVVCQEDIAASLNAVEADSAELTFVYQGKEPFASIAKGPVSHNRLFDSGVKKERRRFDWKKLLTMEIGKKKA